MTLDEKLKARAEMRAAGITVRPDTSGGFLVTGVPSLDYLWAATRESAWANAYGWWAAVHMKDRTGG